MSEQIENVAPAICLLTPSAVHDAIRDPCLGLRAVYVPVGPTPAVDVVFVHGLQGHAIKTWIGKRRGSNLPGPVDLSDGAVSAALGESAPANKKTARSLRTILASTISRRKPPGPAMETASTASTDSGENLPNVFWPQDLLPQECPEARILTWGYDTKVSKFGGGPSNKNTVFSHAKDLLFALARTTVSERPLIFVAHSFGGIVVKEMLSVSDVSEEPGLRGIVQRAAAVVFLGTPHRGSVDMAKLGNRARKLVSAILFDTSSATLDTLGLRTSDLERCQEAFSRLWARYDFQVKTFQEGLGLSGFGISLLNDKVVPSFSSLLGDPREHAETLQANHRDMCRFSGPDDPNARQVLGELRSLYSSLMQVKQSVTVAAGAPVISPITTQTALGLPSVLEDNEKACLRSLRFRDMYRRHQSTRPPCPGTCNWLFENSTFQDWHRNEGPNSVLWILGKPGSGKSVLMQEAEHRLSQADRPEAIYLSYSFDAKGNELQRNPEGAYRSLLHQLLCLPSQRNGLQYAAAEYSQKSEPIEIMDPVVVSWTEAELKRMIWEIMICRNEPTARFRIFIDAVDECSGDASDITSFLQNLSDGAVDVKFCFSARHFSSVPRARGSSIITVETHNHADILRYLDVKLVGTIEDIGGAEAFAELVSYKDTIAEMSSGIFLWVVLVVDIVNRYLDRGRNRKFVHDQLQKVPTDLDALFRNLLRKPSEDQFTTRRVFYWACLGGELRLREWRHILPFIRHPVPSSLAQCRNSEFYAETDEQLEKQIRHISMGLIEVVRPTAEVLEHDSDDFSLNAGAGSLDPELGESRIVQLIHGSVREFFLNDGGFDCLGLSFYPIADGYTNMLSTCLDYIEVAELDELALARERARPLRMPSFEAPGPVYHPTHRPTETVNIDWEGIKVRRGGSGGSSAGSFCSASSLRYARSLGPNKPPSQTIASPKVAPLSILSHSNLGGRREEDLVSPVKQYLASEVEYLSGAHATLDAYLSMRVARGGGSVRTADTVSSLGRQSCLRLLEDYPALLSYVLTTFFHHIRSAQERGCALEQIWSRMDDGGMWKRWSSLRGDIPSFVTLSEWAEREGCTFPAKLPVAD